MKMTGLKNLFAAAAVVAALSSCHCSANDNTSRPGTNDENGRNVGNNEIEKNFAPGSDCNPTNDMYDGISGNKHGEGAEGHGGESEGHEKETHEKEGH